MDLQNLLTYPLNYAVYLEVPVKSFFFYSSLFVFTIQNYSLKNRSRRLMEIGTDLLVMGAIALMQSTPITFAYLRDAASPPALICLKTTMIANSTKFSKMVLDDKVKWLEEGIIWVGEKN